MHTIKKLTKIGTLLHDGLINEGINLWYGEAGEDAEIAVMILRDVPLKEIKEYIREHYGEEGED